MQFTSRSRSSAVAALLTTVAVAAVAGPSGAQPGLTVTFTAGVFQGEALVAVGTLGVGCDDVITAADVSFDFNGTPTDLVTVGDFTTNSFSFVIPPELTTEPAPATTALLVSVSCANAGAPATRSESIGWAQIQVTKTVVGDGPLGARFPMLVECDSTMGDIAGFAFDLADGESWSVFAVTAGSCAVEESDDLGASATEITPSGEVTITSSSLFPVAVVNTFPQAPPGPLPTPEPSPEPVPVVTPSSTG